MGTVETGFSTASLEVIVPLLLRLILLLMFALPSCAMAETLEKAFSDFRKCEFKGFYYAPWSPEQPVHPYIAERGLTPYKEENGLYFFKVKDTLFGLPVSEIVIPGTWDFHAVKFDVPLTKAQKVFKQRFSSVFSPSPKSAEGTAPALETVENDRNRSFLYCNEAEGGE